MIQKFRLFVQKHENGTYTITVPGVQHVVFADLWDEEPSAPRLAAHGLMLEEVKDDLRQALEKWLPKADPAFLHTYNNYKEGQSLEKVDVELRPSDSEGRKRRDKVRLKVSLLVTKEENGQYLVRVPRLLDPPLAFYCYAPEELKETATRELSAYFNDHSLEDLLDYQHGRQEFLEEVEVSFTPLKPHKERKKTEEQESREFWALKAAGVNLSARLKEGRLLRAYRRDREIEELVSALAAERNNGVLLVGPSGVGKTAIVHEVVRRIKEEKCPPVLRKRQVWYTSPAQLIAGCSYLGQWEEKLKNIVEEVKHRRHLLLIDDLVGLIEVGRHAKGDENMAQFLKPYLQDGTLVVMGESTLERYRVGENKDSGFLRLFRALPVEETKDAETLSILGTVAAGLERHFNLRIEPGATEAAVELTRRFQPYRAFPGKAVGFLEQVANDAAKPDAVERAVITRQAAVSAFARYTGLPEFLLSDHHTLDPADVERYFAERLIGQPDAVRTVTDLVTVLKAGLNDPHKPLGGFFFVGPTGVGKTEMAKTLAEYLFGSRDRLIRFDMSEYAEPYNVAKLIGTAYGSEESELTKRIRLQPFSVVLLDEFEKANAAVFDVLLQVLGEGRLTDAAGRTADFRSAIVLMTSNLGASPREQRKPGLRGDETGRALESHFRERVEEFFRPEFVNRLDRIVVFRPLDREAMRQIASRELKKLLEREGVTRRGLLVEVDEEIIDLLLQTGFSPEYGARPLKREIERRIIVPFARYLVAHRVVGSQLIRIGRDGEAVRIEAVTLQPAKAIVKRGPSPLTVSDGAGGGKRTLKELIEAFAALRLRLHAWADSDAVREIGNEYRRLLARTRKRNFTRYGQEAHQTWSRVYQLERLTRRVAQLKERAEYLEEFAAMVQRERSGQYEPDLAQNHTELQRDLDYLEVELLCAHLKESGQALLRLGTLGRTVRADGLESWTVTLAKMYLRWAKRKGYEFGVFLPTDVYKRWIEAQSSAVKAYVPDYDEGPPLKPPWAEVKTSDFHALLKRLEAIEPSELVLAVRGANVYGFLKGEAGAHKLLLREEEYAAAPFQTARVEVEAPAEDVTAQVHLIRAWEAAEKAKAENGNGRGSKGSRVDEALPEIVRVYAPDGNRYVRDLRTDVQTTLVRDVLEGDLDAFILAYLKTTEAETAWEGVGR